MGVESRGGNGLSPVSNAFVFDIAILWKWDMDESHVEMLVSVMAMRFLQALSGGLEPVDLIWLEPVVATVVGLVW